MDVKTLSRAQCVLLAVNLASESNIPALHSFTPARHDALDPELVLRIILTYLPEAVDPREYVGYVNEVASRLYLDVGRRDVDVSTAPVKDINDEQAQKRVKKLHLLPMDPPSFPPHAPNDLLTKFLCHRAYQIDSETGLLNLVPALVEPYLARNAYLRTWYISVVLPILRLEIDYYPDDQALGISLGGFESMSGQEGVELLLKRNVAKQDNPQNNICRDIKGLVGPWMYGHTERKRRKLGPEAAPSPGLQPLQTVRSTDDPVEGVAQRIRKISLDGVGMEDLTGHDWECMYRWMIQHAADNFSLITRAVEGWDGPGDVDLGEFERAGIQYLDEDVQTRLERQYAQAAFASCYVPQDDNEQTIHDAHAILSRLAELLDFIPPPDLATSVESLPKLERHAVQLDQSQTIADLLPASLLRPEHPLTTPKMETYMLLQMMVYSAYQFSSLGHPLSLVHVAKLHFYATKEEQLDVLRKILRDLMKSGARKDETQWSADRAKLLWLWDWGIDIASGTGSLDGPGVLGKIARDTFEEEMLKVFTETSCYELIINLYLKNGQHDALSGDKAESIILSKAMEAYDSATNGNKIRGAMKKANDIINTFRPYYPRSIRFQQASALISATHALSYYSLTLQHGVPFQPVSIRVSQDPLSLISKVLEQNPRSFDKLEDLIDIARNLVSAGLAHTEEGTTEPSTEELARWRKDAERRVTFMAVEAALREDDFETAYSYIVNRLTPSGADIEAPSNEKQHKRTRSSRTKNQLDDDDISWRAAFLAGRYRPQPTSPPTLRRLEQRTELLSLALLLAPVSALTEILAAWRRCEEEMTSLHLSQQQAEQEFDDRADKRLSGASSALPGNFTVSGELPALILNQKRREMGRMGAARAAGDGETPLSMFDLTRSAARAFSKTAASLQSAPPRSSGEYARSMSMEESTGSLGSELDSDGQPRVRKRDMVANAVTGSLATSLGWVLGATPVQQQPQQ